MNRTGVVRILSYGALLVGLMFAVQACNRFVAKKGSTSAPNGSEGNKGGGDPAGIGFDPDDPEVPAKLKEKPGHLSDAQTSVMEPGSVTKTNLFNELFGFGLNAKGGLGGQKYVVTRSDDSVPPVPGQLRYGVEVQSGPTWVVFDPSVFTADTKKAIYLEAPLRLLSNTTIDGRGSYVSLRRLVYLDEANWTQAPSGNFECTLKPDHAHQVGPIIHLRSVENVILTHLDFQQEYQGVISDPAVPDFADYTRVDTQCFGDVISIDNGNGTESDQVYDDIWINHSNFTRCGDECIGITHPNLKRRAYLTISNNIFTSTYKGIVLGGLATDASFMIAASLYRNRFVGVNERQPRIGKAYAHVFNNVFEDWRTRAIFAASFTRTVVEGNIFLAVSQPEYAWSTATDASNTALWAQRNKFSSNVNAAAYTTGSFPECGSTWYHQCKVPIIDVMSLDYNSALTTLRAYGGWIAVPNDVL
jgi:hypothetical protein